MMDVSILETFAIAVSIASIALMLHVFSDQEQNHG